jgi:REP-associated tyrosine transposase
MSDGRAGIVKKEAGVRPGGGLARSLAHMPRPPRIQLAGGTYHVTSRGNRRQSIYHDDDDRRSFLAMRDRVVVRCGWRVHAYCLMTNHFHLLVETPRPNLSAGMQRLKCEYAAYFNERHSLVGHLFQQRFGSRLIETEEHLLEALSYIAFNPVRAGLCEHPSEWPWSSFHGAAELVFDR